MKKITVPLFLLLSATVFSQTKQQKKWGYEGSLTPGYAIGQTSGGYILQTTHGIQRRNIFIGIATGVDEYLMLHVPFLPHVEYRFGNAKEGPLLYAQGGPSIPVKTKEWNNKLWTEHKQYDLHGAWMAEAGIGYRWNLSGKKAFLLQAGYSQKTTMATEYVPNFMWWISSSIPPPSATSHTTQQMKYVYNRIVLKAGISF
ncbi:hypothetical protein [Parasegetibacter sp. NRK P23]|uniref:hypothetical protein n=1 Tax=Parasegetibacter sp. NRK P23 TaxID=2942999 RepID=UPI002044A02D|nr:hypothetical protein [Parasegetibacter sp. NRK P23]MCM5527326.1 hypothetical protein [Parasegetibacter sp. NRK P23]